MNEPPDDEDLRLEAVQKLDLLDQPAEERFERIVRLVRRHFRASACAITLLDTERAYYVAHYGMNGRQSPRSTSMCAQVVEGKLPIVYADQTPDSQSPIYRALIQRLDLSFYAGVPILDPDGYAVGALCIMDHIPRKFTRRELESLADFAAITEHEFQVLRTTEANRELISQVEKLRIRAFLDPLTGVWNRRGLFDVLNREMERSRRADSPLCLCMLDLDHFKRINDTYGHPAGDVVLEEACVRIRDAVRPYDALGRYGGEEFLLVFPETDLEKGRLQAERVRQAVAERPFPCDSEAEEDLTISVGVAQVADDESVTDTIARADKALYTAKREGRNRVVCSAREKKS